MIAGWPKVTCQRDKIRLCDNFRPRVYCEQSRGMIISTKIDHRAAKQQPCNEN